MDTKSETILIGALRLNVGNMQDIGLNNQPPTTISVVAKPLPDNESHAEIIEELSRKLAKKIIKYFEDKKGYYCIPISSKT